VKNKKRNATLQAVVDKANEFMNESPDSDRPARKMLAVFVDSLLFEARCYNGYNYLYWLETGYDQWVKDGRPDFLEKDPYIYGPTGDDSRVRFY
jgi:hypothetical protein